MPRGRAASAGVGAETVNVKVAVRVRPMSTSENERGCAECIALRDGRFVEITGPDGKSKDFAYDHAYGADATQGAVYRDLALPVVQQALAGFNGTLFAYGQTGSGKTHSVIGTADDPGLVPRMNAELFELLRSKSLEDGSEFLVTASYLEIYNEVIRDLLNPSPKQLRIREHPTLGIYVDQLAELVVESATEIAALLEQGGKVKQVAATQMNARSSRSHCCFVVKLQQRRSEVVTSAKGETVTRESSLSAKMNLVDLAGSERAAKTGATGSRLKEGAAINLSLSTLGTVINVLAEGGAAAGQHIPYRNSKLTRLLQESLGGNAHTVMLAALSPADYNFSESLSTLQYAARASKIQNETKANEDVNQTVIRELRSELERLRAQMAAMEEEQALLRHGPGGSSSAGDEVVATAEAVAAQVSEAAQAKAAADAAKLTAMKRKVEELEKAKRTQWKEVQKLSAAYAEERERNLADEGGVRSVMQSVKEENVALLKRLKLLQQEKVQLAAQYKKSRAGYTALKAKLEAGMAAYRRADEELKALPNGADGDADRERLQPLLASTLADVERDRTALVKEKARIVKLKRRLDDVAAEALEQRAQKVSSWLDLPSRSAPATFPTLQHSDNRPISALHERVVRIAAQKVVLGEDAELRKKIHEEERDALNAERQLIERNAEAEASRLEELYSLRATVAQGRERELEQRVHELELEAVMHRNDKSLLLLELNFVESQVASLRESVEAANAVRGVFEERVAAEVARQLASVRAEQRMHVKALIDGFEAEQRKLERRVQRACGLAEAAARDAVALHDANERLQRELSAAVAWEPTARGR